MVHLVLARPPTVFSFRATQRSTDAVGGCMQPAFVLLIWIGTFFVLGASDRTSPYRIARDTVARTATCKLAREFGRQSHRASSLTQRHYFFPKMCWQFLRQSDSYLREDSSAAMLPPSQTRIHPGSIPTDEHSTQNPPDSSGVAIPSPRGKKRNRAGSFSNSVQVTASPISAPTKRPLPTGWPSE